MLTPRHGVGGPPAAPARRLRRPGWLLGLALGGFFDGIVLHQILQWHHLLSAVGAMRDLRLQILADGLFHAVMFVLAVLGLWHLWRQRFALAEPGAAPVLWSSTLLGFGGWHLADAVLSHWLLGIHRIRMDTSTPLLWDLGWLAVFGAVPLALGAWLRWRGGTGTGTGPGAGRGGGQAAAAALALAVTLAGPWSAWPGEAGAEQVVVFAPGVGGAQAFDALARVDARILWADAGGGVWAVRLTDRAQAWRLLADGAVIVGRAGMALGCVAWTKSL